MAHFECQQLEIGLEFVRWSCAERNNFSEGSSEPKKYAQVIWVRGQEPHDFFKLELLVALPLRWPIACSLLILIVPSSLLPKWLPKLTIIAQYRLWPSLTMILLPQVLFINLIEHVSCLLYWCLLCPWIRAIAWIFRSTYEACLIFLCEVIFETYEIARSICWHLQVVLILASTRGCSQAVLEYHSPNLQNYGTSNHYCIVGKEFNS